MTCLGQSVLLGGRNLCISEEEGTMLIECVMWMSTLCMSQSTSYRVQSIFNLLKLLLCKVCGIGAFNLPSEIGKL